MSRIRTIAYIVWMDMLRRKDVYVLLVLLAALLIVLISMNVFGLGGVVRYIKDIGILMAWIFSWLLAVTVSSRTIPQEESRGTIYPLLAKPVTRFEFVAGKWLGSWTIISAATAVFYLLVVGVVLLRGGSFSETALLQGYVLHCTALGIVTAITLAFSARMNPDAAASISFVLTATAFMVVPRIPEFLVRARGLHANLLMIMYHILPHFEVLDMRKRIVHNFGPEDWNIFLAQFLYGMLMTSAFVCIAWLAYRNKRFTRGSML